MNRNTQGNQKINQLIDDIFRNYHFISKMVKALELMRDDPRNESNIVYEKTLSALKSEYEAYYIRAKSRLEALKSPADKLIDELSKEYNIDSQTIMLKLESGHLSEVIGNFPDRDFTKGFDLCDVEDRYISNVGDDDNMPYPSFLVPSRESKVSAYPVSLNIHRFASKRDVIDYLDKNWSRIREFQGKYQPRVKKIRRRKFSREFEDFVWNNRKLSADKLIDLLEAKFPKELADMPLAYTDINYVKDEEKRRRKSDLT